MTEFNPINPVNLGSRPEPLPAEFDREQRAVDALLSASAQTQAQTTPAGLSQRVFEASIARMPMPLEALPAEFDAELQAVDAMLKTISVDEIADAPHGLAERVYQASVAHMPALADTHLKLVGVGAPSSGATATLRWSIWQRLSLAASVVIVGGIAWWALTQQPPAPQPRVAIDGGRGSASEAHLAADISRQFSTLNNLTDDLSDFENEVAYLLDATQVLSVADLNHDFDAATQRIDM